MCKILSHSNEWQYTFPHLDLHVCLHLHTRMCVDEAESMSTDEYPINKVLSLPVLVIRRQCLLQRNKKQFVPSPQSGEIFQGCFNGSTTALVKLMSYSRVFIVALCSQVDLAVINVFENSTTCRLPLASAYTWLMFCFSHSWSPALMSECAADLMCGTCLSSANSVLHPSVEWSTYCSEMLCWYCLQNKACHSVAMWLTWLWLLQRSSVIAWIMFHCHSQTLVINYGHVAGQVWISDIMWRLWGRRSPSWHEEKCVWVCEKDMETLQHNMVLWFFKWLQLIYLWFSSWIFWLC